jgi:hypothetical protein
MASDTPTETKIVRTRNPALIDTSDIVVDVGAIYDPARHRYDHHQRYTPSASYCCPHSWAQGVHGDHAQPGQQEEVDDKAKQRGAGVLPLWPRGVSVVHVRPGDLVLDYCPRDGRPLCGRAALRQDVRVLRGGGRCGGQRHQPVRRRAPVCGLGGARPRSPSTRYKVSSTVGQRVGALNPPWNAAEQDYDVCSVPPLCHVLTLPRLVLHVPWRWSAPSLWTS